MKFIAHRGVVTKNIKENTISSFILAINDDNYVGFELDIRESKDGNLYVYHDYLLNGKQFNKYNSKELKKLKIPLLKSVLNLNHSKIVLLEIKDFNMNLKSLKKLLDNHQELNIYVMSFSNKVIKNLFKLNINCKIGILNYVFNNQKQYEYDFIGLLNVLLNKEKIECYKNNNIEVMSYGILRKQKLNYNNIYYIIDSDKMF